MARCWLDFHNSDKTAILAGCGRSGTTWLGDILNFRNTFRMMFEPFYPAKVPELQSVWRPQQYLRPDATGPGPDRARAILAGRLRNDWVDQFNTRKIASRRLIKDVRLNLALGWIRAAFPKMPIVFILRHPIPTALSQLKLEWKLQAPLFLEQPELMADHLEPFRRELEAPRDPFEAQIAIWCAMNIVPLRQFANGGLHLVFYEDLCRRPQEVLPSLFSHIGVGPADGALRLLSRPSALSKSFSAVLRGDDPVESWRREVTEDQIRRAAGVLERFGLDRLYGPGSLPKTPAEGALQLFLK
ncbi:MAG: sulfotransferase [Kiritimatiellia bacterium]